MSIKGRFQVFKMTGKNKMLGAYCIETIDDPQGAIRVKLESDLFRFEGSPAGLLKSSVILMNTEFDEPCLLSLGGGETSVRFFERNENFEHEHGVSFFIQGLIELLSSEGIEVRPSLEIYHTDDTTMTMLAVCRTGAYSAVITDIGVEEEEDIITDYLMGTNPLTPELLMDYERKFECEKNGFPLLNKERLNMLTQEEYQETSVEFYSLSDELKESFCRERTPDAPAFTR